MIALQGISQVKYTIDSKCYTCYTSEENRAIAILILKGERDSVMLVNSYKAIEALQAEIVSLNTKADITYEMAKLNKRTYDTLYEMSIKQDNQNNRLKLALQGTGLLSITLIILMIL